MPFNTRVIFIWDETRFLVDAATCAQESGIEFLIRIAEPRPVIVAVFFKRVLLAGVRSQCKVEDMIAYLSRNPTEKRGLLLWIGIACVNWCLGGYGIA